MVRDDVAIVRELFVADRAYPVLLNNLPVQQFSHLCRCPEFPVSSRVMRIVDTLNSKPQRPGFGDEFPTTTGMRFVDWTKFIAAEPHVIPPVKPTG